MIVRSGQPFTLRDLFDRFSLISIQRRVDRYCRPRLNRRRHTFAVLGVWSLVSDLAGRSAVHLRDPPERFRRFCPDCREDTAHEGFDELGVGWYAQIRGGRWPRTLGPGSCSRTDALPSSVKPRQGRSASTKLASPSPIGSTRIIGGGRSTAACAEVARAVAVEAAVISAPKLDQGVMTPTVATEPGWTV